MTERRRTGERRNHLMTDQEMAELVSVSVNTVRYWRQTGILPFVRGANTPGFGTRNLRGFSKNPCPIGY